MTCAQRIRTIRLLEKMEGQPEYSKKLGLEDVSRFRGNGTIGRIQSVMNDLNMWEKQIGGM